MLASYIRDHLYGFISSALGLHVPDGNEEDRECPHSEQSGRCDGCRSSPEDTKCIQYATEPGD